MRSDSEDDSSSDHKSSTVCYLCRQRKTKCDRTLPKCGFCVKAKVNCQYVVNPQKRGLRAGYVSQLENRIESLEQEVSGLKTSQRTPNNPVLVGNISPPITSPTTSTPLPIPASASSLTPSTIDGNPRKRQRLETESDRAVTDLSSLPPSIFFTLADLWFKETQPWCPILNREHIQAALDEIHSPVTHIDDIVLRAVISLEIAYSTQAICLGYRGRHRLSQHLRSQVLTEALSKASLSSLQSLIIIALLDYGMDNISSTFGLLSVCRRMCENIGLFRKLLSQIEHQSPAQVGPPSRETMSGEEVAVPLTWGTLALDAVSTLGVSWRDVSAALVDHLSSIAYVSSPDLRDSFRAHTHLAAIGLQPVHTFIYEHGRSRYDNANEEALATCDDVYHNLMGYIRPEPAYTILADGAIDFDPNLVHTSILSYASVIVMYQRLIDFVQPISEVPFQRCVQACEDIITTIRNLSDADAELNTPLLGTFLFVAARFKLICYRNLGQEREAAFDTLMHGLNMCGRRWPVARRQDIILRAAIVEVESYTSTSLPADFWNVKKSHLDISEELKEWVEGYKPSLYVGCLNGPYV